MKTKRKNAHEGPILKISPLSTLYFIWPFLALRSQLSEADTITDLDAVLQIKKPRPIKIPMWVLHRLNDGGTSWSDFSGNMFALAGKYGLRPLLPSFLRIYLTITGAKAIQTKG